MQKRKPKVFVYAHQIVPGMYWYNPIREACFKVIGTSGSYVRARSCFGTEGYSVPFLLSKFNLELKDKRWRIVSKVEGLFGVGE